MALWIEEECLTPHGLDCGATMETLLPYGTKTQEATIQPGMKINSKELIHLFRKDATHCTHCSRKRPHLRWFWTVLTVLLTTMNRRRNWILSKLGLCNNLDSMERTNWLYWNERRSQMWIRLRLIKAGKIHGYLLHGQFSRKKQAKQQNEMLSRDYLDDGMKNQN